MAKAPLSQTLFLTEDGSKIDVIVTNAVTIPPRVVIPDDTTVNTLASSNLLSARVIGESAIYAALYPRLFAVKARIEAVRNRRLALVPRITVLEGGTATTPVIPPATTDPAYGPSDQVVQNATRLSDFLDTVGAAEAAEDTALDATRLRIEALKIPPIPATAIKNDAGGYVVNDAGGYVLTGA